MVFRYSTEEKRNGIYTRQCVFMFLTHGAAFLSLCVQTGDMEYLFFYGFEQIILFASICMFQMLYPNGNRLIINNMCMLLGIGFIMLARLSMTKAIKQFLIVVVSMVFVLLIPYIMRKYKSLRDLTWLYALAGVVSLGGVLFLGSLTNGSKLSFSIGGVTFQPSEMVKIVFVFLIAGILSKSHNLLQIVKAGSLAAVHVLILVLSRDLGSALIFFVVYFAMVFFATGKIRYLALGAGSGAAASVLAYRIFTHVQVRVQAWRDPWSVIDSEGFQITQSLFAICSGGLFGLGLLQGTPKSIPYVETDFIFAAITEELGIIFSLCLILICLSCFIMFVNISLHLRDEFYQLTAFGLGICYIFQVFLTIGGGVKFIPLTGVTLPLVSYGGSSVLATLVMFAVIEGLYIIRQEEEIRLAREKSIRERKRIRSSQTEKNAQIRDREEF
ncbi:MAG: FtsW/RodA/SpoVE family cell cycle protein [Lachnospiraceae bacterium]|nr:FtsW/RodA/SpoVE family cell cycle protein [Lachnospiraceae bacterium]